MPAMSTGPTVKAAKKELETSSFLSPAKTSAKSRKSLTKVQGLPALLPRDFTAMAFGLGRLQFAPDDACNPD